MIKNYQELVDKVKKFNKKNKYDLATEEDLSLAIMNLVAIEEHLFFTGEKTGKNSYFDLLKETREMRKKLMEIIVKNPEGEGWCLSKHFLAASMRLMEVGTKLLGVNRKVEAQQMFKKAFNLYSLFWGIALKAINTKGIKKIDDLALNKHDQEKSGFMCKLSQLVRRAIDCCIE